MGKDVSQRASFDNKGTLDMISVIDEYPIHEGIAMQIKDRLAARLIAARKFSEGLLKTFHKPEDWLYRVHPTANHALWIVGHITHVDNSVLTMLSPSDAVDKAVTERLFSPGSEPQDDASVYPSPEELLTRFRDRREKLLAFLDRQTEQSLSEPVPAGAPPMFSDIGSVFEILTFHEAMHMGQLTVVRQVLKHPRLVNFPARS
jgi:hypothetical protein